MNGWQIHDTAKTRVLVVNQQTLTEARDKARVVSRSLHQIESLAELDWEELNALCRLSQQTESLLQEMLDARDAAFSHTLYLEASEFYANAIR